MRRAVRITRQAISPRLAMRRDLIIERRSTGAAPAAGERPTHAAWLTVSAAGPSAMSLSMWVVTRPVGLRPNRSPAQAALPRPFDSAEN